VPPFKDEQLPETPADLPGWLRDLGQPDKPEQRAGGSPESAGEQPAGEQGRGEEIPEEPDIPAPSEEEPRPEAEPEQADLPGWLQRASQDAEPASQEAVQPEDTGPLAGLTGLLLAEQGLSRLPGQATRPLHLKVSANQRLHADLLRSLLEEEGQARPVPKRPVPTSQRIQRWLIALVLILAVLWPVLRGGRPAALDTYNEEAAELNRLVSQLPPNARVLLACDYEPAFSAEIEAAAAPVLDHLLLRGATLAIVSTTPTGPVLAERYLHSFQDRHPLASGVQYVNLGFIPGGAAGLLSLVEMPARTVPYTIDGVAAWGTADSPALPPLQGVGSFEDFSLVLVLVDDPDLARAWIEQVAPRLASGESTTALTMVASAQAEPLLTPYYLGEPRLLHGFIAGLRGGVAYARMTGREGLAQDYWQAFEVGVFVMASILVVGAVLHATTLSGQAPAAGKREEAA
jgi:hypothetical protein